MLSSASSLKIVSITFSIRCWLSIKYLSGEDFERYHFSCGWVFPGWIGFSQWIKREFGEYPPRDMLVELGRMGKEERKEHTWFGLYLWEKKRVKRVHREEL